MSGALDKLTPEEEAQLRDDKAAESATDAVEAPRPEPPAPEGPPPAEPTQTPAMIDKRAFDEERGRRKRLESQLAEEQAKAAAAQARVEERLRLLAEATQARLDQQAAAEKPPEEPAPAWETDPAGAIQHGFKSQERLIRELSQRLQQVETGAQNLTQAQQNQQALNDLVQWGQGQEAEFSREVGHEEYNRATAWLKSLYLAEQEIRGNPTDVALQNVQREILTRAWEARQNGRNFGKVLWDIAGKLGYQKTDGSSAAPAAPTAAAPPPPAGPQTATERMLRGQEMATTVGTAGGASRAEPAAQHIANMSDEEFDRYYAKYKKDGGDLRALFGS